MTEKELSQRLDLLERKMARVQVLYEKCLKYETSDPETALIQARKAAEAICNQIYQQEGLEQSHRPLSKMTLDMVIAELQRRNHVPRKISIPLRTIQQYGNYGGHDQGSESEEITSAYIQPCLHALSTVVGWYANSYHSAVVPIPKVVPARTPAKPAARPVTAPSSDPRGNSAEILAQLRSVLESADLRPNETASDAGIRKSLKSTFQAPLAAQIAALNGPRVKHKSGPTKSACPQYISEVRLELPPVGVLRADLATIMQRGMGPYIGATIVQQWEDYPAHIRWGLWSHTPALADSLAHYYRNLCSELGWQFDNRYVRRSVTNAGSWTLSLLGGLRTLSDLQRYDSPDSLYEEIAGDMVKLSRAVTD